MNLALDIFISNKKFNLLIIDARIPKLLADEVVFLALKVSVAMGYLAPEYITTRCFTEKRDIYTFGVIILHVLSGKMTIGSSIQTTVESYGGKNTFKACNTVYS
ncbi:LRR receptor-like serine/threonine-protein kinase FEI 2 [Glycine soja]